MRVGEKVIQRRLLTELGWDCGRCASSIDEILLDLDEEKKQRREERKTKSFEVCSSDYSTPRPHRYTAFPKQFLLPSSGTSTASAPSGLSPCSDNDVFHRYSARDHTCAKRDGDANEDHQGPDDGELKRRKKLVSSRCRRGNYLPTCKLYWWSCRRQCEMFEGVSQRKAMYKGVRKEKRSSR